MARVLVIDDEDVVRDFLRDALMLRGHEVEEAEDGEKGLESVRRNPPDLVISDIMMPNMTGLEVVEKLREMHPDIKIISIAAVGDRLLEQAEELGANRTFEKPFHMKDILDAVDDLLES